MNSFCPNCGKENLPGATFCAGCGSALAAQAQTQVQAQAAPQYNYTGAPMLAERNLVLAIILSLLTCGIYGLYWFIVLTDDANKVSGENDTSGGLALLLTLVTCGIYGFFWYYKMGKKLYTAGQRSGKDISDNGVLYILLGLFGLGIVNYALIQNDLNKFSK